MSHLLELIRTRSVFAAIIAFVLWPRFSVTSFLMLRRLRALGLNPTLIMDVGANEGQFAVAATRIFTDAQVVSFEPQRRAFARLEKNLRRTARAECHMIALGATTGRATLHVTSDDRSSSLREVGVGHFEAFPGTVPMGTTDVPVARLDDVVDLPVFGGEPLLKLDVQGFEDEVLRGAERTLQRTQWVLLECSFRQMYSGEASFAELEQRMSRGGFEVFGIVDVMRSRTSDIIVQADVLFRKRNDSEGGPDDTDRL